MSPVTDRPSQPSHTPGPWRTNIARRSDDAICAAHVVGADGSNVAQVAIYEQHEGVSTEANACLLAAAPEYRDAANAYDTLIESAQEILAAYIRRDGHDGETACLALLDLLDGPPWRAARAKYAVATAKSENPQRQNNDRADKIEARHG